VFTYEKDGLVLGQLLKGFQEGREGEYGWDTRSLEPRRKALMEGQSQGGKGYLQGN